MSHHHGFERVAGKESVFVNVVGSMQNVEKGVKEQNTLSTKVCIVAEITNESDGFLDLTHVHRSIFHVAPDGISMFRALGSVESTVTCGRATEGAPITSYNRNSARET